MDGHNLIEDMLPVGKLGQDSCRLPGRLQCQSGKVIMDRLTVYVHHF